jgi:hypothetical protein
MISSVVEVWALGGSLENLRASFDQNVMKHNNMVPSQGLMLWSTCYDRYNEKNKEQAWRGFAVDYQIGSYLDIMDSMERLRDSIVPEIARESEAIEKHFTYFLMQSIHTLPRT